MSQKELTILQNTLQKAGYSLTKPRQLVFELLLSTEPQAMGDLIKQAAGRIDRASVYRTAELFEKIGVIHRVYIGWKYKLELSDDFLPHHHHLSCLACGKINDIHDDSLVDFFISQVALKSGFKPQRHQFEIEGLCAECRGLKSSAKISSSGSGGESLGS